MLSFPHPITADYIAAFSMVRFLPSLLSDFYILQKWNCFSSAICTFAYVLELKVLSARHDRPSAYSFSSNFEPISPKLQSYSKIDFCLRFLFFCL